MEELYFSRVPVSGGGTLRPDGYCLHAKALGRDPTGWPRSEHRRALRHPVYSSSFALMHGPQLRFSWGPVLVIFLVSLVLTIVRAKTNSVAAGVLIHMGYNGAITLRCSLPRVDFAIWKN